MIDITKIDLSELDRPDVLRFLFHPRAEWRPRSPHEKSKDIFIPVDHEVVIGARFHMVDTAAPNILFFHGNGEIVSDYDELGSIYNGIGVNFLPVDYRGYGQSSGTPGITAMMRDCHVILDFIIKWLRQNRYSAPLTLMGRSLGSVSAIELAACYPDAFGGLVVESGFAHTGPLLQLLGVDIERIEFKEENGFRNSEKIQKVNRPTLIIHAEHDHIIPFSDARILYDACPSDRKTLLEIPGANHNDIFLRGASAYLSAVMDLIKKR